MPESYIELPSDYEECGECGFDHEYEPEEAKKAHELISWANQHQDDPED